MKHQTPHDHDLEKTVLSTALIWPEETGRIISTLSAADFHNGANRAIFKAMANVYETTRIIDMMSISEATRSAGTELAPDIIGLLQLAGANEALNITHHLNRLKTYTAARQLIALSGQLATEAGQLHINGNLSDYQRQIGQIDRRMMGPAEATTATARAEFEADQIWRRDNPGVLRGLSTGIDALDRLYDGMMNNKIYMIGGRPKMGKSVVGLAFLAKATRQIDPSAGERVAIFTLEMSRSEIITRLVANGLKVDSESVSKMKLSPAQLEKQGKILDYLDKTILIDDTPGVTPQYIENRLMGWHDEGYSIRMVVIDHFHLMKPTRETGHDTANGRAIANDLVKVSKMNIGRDTKIKAPFIVLAQVKKAVDQRPNKRPFADDIEGSGAISQVAQAVTMLYRDDHYNNDPDSPSLVPGQMELLIRLNRDRPGGVVKVAFKGDQSRIHLLGDSVDLNNAPKKIRPINL